MKRRRTYLIIVYPYNGKPVWSQRVACFNEPTWEDISRLERYFNGKVVVD